MGKLTNYDIVNGEPIPPIDRLRIMSENAYEDTITEWATEYLSTKYEKVRNPGGAGDGGRDVIGYINESKKIYDNYQCKHYAKALTPGDIWLELGKLIYFTFIGEITIPNKYYFVCPNGIGPKATRLLENPQSINDELISHWPSKCAKKITKTKEIELTDELSSYIKKFDFGIVSDVQPAEFIIQFRKTKFYPSRFGGGLTKFRPETDFSNLNDKDARYIEQLLKAYSDYKKEKFEYAIDLKENAPELHKHLQRQRENFHSANTLKAFVRDSLPDESFFENLSVDFFDALIDIVEEDFDNAYKRVKEVLKRSTKIEISNPIQSDPHFKFSIKDRYGICHQLVEDEKIEWVGEDD